MTTIDKEGRIEEVSFRNKSIDSLVITDRIEAILKQWDQNSGDMPYASSDYLRLLEKFGPIDYSYYYALLKKDNRIVGLIYCQHKPLELHKDFRVHTHSDGIYEKIKVKITKTLFRLVRNDILICGNVLLTGEYGIRIDETVEVNNNELVTQVLEKIRTFIKKHHKVKIKSTLLKDFYIAGPLRKQEFKSNAYTNFKVQPDMIITIRKEWKSYDDYLASVKSKYRVKFRKVKKKGSELNFRLLSTADAAKYNTVMYNMYKEISERATFNMFLLDENYFLKLKETFEDNLILYGVFHGDELVAFFTYLRNGKVGDAHFLGYKPEINNKYQIYFNILLRLIETAIEDKADYLNLSRTALEIKSSVGAEAYDMEVHLHYHIGWINKLLPFLLGKFVPENKWLPRSPFK